MILLSEVYPAVIMSEELSFREIVWLIIAAIPYGPVCTYGEIARLAGNPRAARQVGGVLKKLPEGSSLPWHRVVDRQGRISLQGADFRRQQQALEAENIEFTPMQTIDLEKYRWPGHSSP